MSSSDTTPTRHALMGVIGGFLGTYLSRYSDYEGYWLFGFLVDGPEIEIDLLVQPGSTSSPEGRARRLATVKFAEQIDKSRLPRSVVAAASLSIRPGADAEARIAGTHRRLTFGVRFHVSVVSDTGRRYERDQVVFVAPHDARFESRSASATA